MQLLHQGVQPCLFALAAAAGGGVQAFAELAGVLLRALDVRLRVLLVQALRQDAQPRLFALAAAVGGGVQAFAELVGALLRGADLSLRALLVQAVGEVVQMLLPLLLFAACRLPQAL